VGCQVVELNLREVEMGKQTDEAFIGDMIALIGQELPTLRDRIAIASLQGLLANQEDVDLPTEQAVEHFAAMSYKYADAMMMAREVRND